MRWAEGFITADWGTTNRRAYLIDAKGKCVDEFEDDKGILSVEKDSFGAAVTEIRQCARYPDRLLTVPSSDQQIAVFEHPRKTRQVINGPVDTRLPEYLCQLRCREFDVVPIGNLCHIEALSPFE